MDLGSPHHLGRPGKPWGHRGELTLQSEEADLEEVLDLGFPFVEPDGLRVPFRIGHPCEHPRVGALVNFEDYSDPQGVRFLVNREVFAPPGHVPPDPDEEDGENYLDPDEFIGMLVLDEEYGGPGRIASTEGTEAHPVMGVRKGEQEIPIHMVDDMITGIDMDTAHLEVRTPPGLVDLYRGS